MLDTVNSLQTMSEIEQIPAMIEFIKSYLHTDNAEKFEDILNNCDVE